MERLAEQAFQKHPERFRGRQPYAFCRVRYVPPCERFPELRRLILCVKEVTGLRAEFRGIMAAEVSEWLGREEEEYFTVLLKYLYDHRDIWQGWLVVRNCPERQMARFLSACALYLTPQGPRPAALPGPGAAGAAAARPLPPKRPGDRPGGGPAADGGPALPPAGPGPQPDGAGPGGGGDRRRRRAPGRHRGGRRGRLSGPGRQPAGSAGRRAGGGAGAPR